jgi:hypothetical protein
MATMAELILPLDPEDDYYLLNCFVCEEVAKPGQSHMRNYGGVVCFSCRQFFRRAHQVSDFMHIISMTLRKSNLNLKILACAYIHTYIHT